MKGIILAGGSGTRLYPLTIVTSKQLLPVYDKPMIYYPLSTLMLAGIRDILIITRPEDEKQFYTLLGDGEPFGVRLSYKVQERPEGIAQALIIGEEFIGDDPCALILGDNLFFGNSFTEMLNEATGLTKEGKATIFGCYVQNPKRFGIVEFDDRFKVLSVEEKPDRPKSNYAITGLYFYPPGVSEYAKQIRPSDRGELEITSLNDRYLKNGLLQAQILGRGITWFDSGTMDSLMEAAEFVRMIERQHGVTISAPEEIAYWYGWITKETLRKSAEKYGKSSYGEHLKAVADGKFVSAVKGSTER